MSKKKSSAKPATKQALETMGRKNYPQIVDLIEQTVYHIKRACAMAQAKPAA